MIDDYGLIVPYRSTLCEIYDWTRHRWREVVLSDIGRRASSASSGYELLQPERMPGSPPTDQSTRAREKTLDILECLNGGSCSVEYIARQTGLQAHNVRRYLRKHDGVLWRRAGKSRGMQRASLWEMIP